MSLKVDQFHRDNGSLQKNLLTTGVKDEQQNHRLTVVGIAVCLCANATAAGGCSIRTVPACRFGPCTSTGPAIGGRVGANGPFKTADAPIANFVCRLDCGRQRGIVHETVLLTS